MNYRNVKTGAVIKTTGKVIGKNWEPVEDTRPPVDDISEDDIVDDISEDDIVDDISEDDIVDDTPDVEPTAEEVPDEKPAAKTTRRSKK